MNHWVMAFPYLMYLVRALQAGGDTLTNTGDVVIGTAYIYQSSETRVYSVTAIDLTLSY